jgi:hypothetical protein
MGRSSELLLHAGTQARIGAGAGGGTIEVSRREAHSRTLRQHLN